MATDPATPPDRRTVLGPALAGGFAVAIALWMAWFITHLPWLGMPERVSIPLLLAVWLGGASWIGALVARDGGGRARGLKVGGLGGLFTALVGLLILGSKLVEPAGAGDAAGAVRPGAVQIVLGFVGLGVAIGAAGGVLGGLLGGPARRERDWLAFFSLVACAAVAPLLFVGGLVTSTNSGMAVPDWPNTYGSNMFLYPLGPRARPDVFLEHSHRLFGTLVGLTAIVLAGWTVMREPRRWVKAMALVALALVVVQGLLGGARVLANSPAAGVVHAVLAQITFAAFIAVAVVLSPLWKRLSAAERCPFCEYSFAGLPADARACPECGAGRPAPIAGGADEPPPPRRARLFATALLHATLLQLVFGAMYRHFRDAHSLVSHIVFAVLVVVAALVAGFVASAVRGEQRGMGPVVRRLGVAAVVVVAVQFILGWAAFFMLSDPVGGRAALDAEVSPAGVVIRTAHQANGALLLAVAMALYLWARRLLARPRPV